MFYNTGIATYIWVLSNRKPAQRQGKVQLIDATQWYKPLRKNLGKKNCELSAEDMARVLKLFLDFEESEQSKIFPNAAFGYWKATVERPLRLAVDLSAAALKRLRRACAEASEGALADVVDEVAAELGEGPHRDYNAFLAAVEAHPLGLRLTTKRAKLLQAALTETDEAAEPVVKKAHRPGKAAADPLRGLFAATIAFGGPEAIDGKPAVAEYEPDPALRDTEQLPLLEEGGVDAFIRREVLPYAPDAWIDESKTQIGYEISFTRYFYKPQPLRSLEEIRADILALEQETEGLLEEILGAIG